MEMYCLECASDNVGISWIHPFNSELDRIRCGNCGAEWRRHEYNEAYRVTMNSLLDGLENDGESPAKTDQNIQWNFKSLTDGNVKIDIVAGGMALNMVIPADDVEMLAAIMNVRAGEAKSNVRQ